MHNLNEKRFETCQGIRLVTKHCLKNHAS